MKKLLLTLLFILGSFNMVFAAEYVTHKNEYFQAAFLKGWKTENYGYSIRTTSPDESCSILICSYPHGDGSLDERVAQVEKDYPYMNRILEKNGDSSINNIPAKYSLYSEKNADNIKDKYYLYYYLYTDDSFYIIWNHGKYNNFDQDRKTISGIISSLEIYK